MTHDWSLALQEGQDMKEGTQLKFFEKFDNYTDGEFFKGIFLALWAF